MAEHLAEHTTKYFTEFPIFGRFAERCSWRSSSAGQTLQEAQTKEASWRAREAQKSAKPVLTC